MKRILSIRIVILLFGIALLSSCSGENSNVADETMSYLEQRYGAKFMLLESVAITDKNTIFSYIACPTDNNKITFTVSQIYTKANVFPFLPSTKHKVFSDNFVDSIKSKVLQDKNMESISLGNVFDVDLVAQKIYNVMIEINSVLQEYNIEATKYSCNITINLIIGETVRSVDFWEMELSTIETLLQTAATH